MIQNSSFVFYVGTLSSLWDVTVMPSLSLSGRNGCCFACTVKNYRNVVKFRILHFNIMLNTKQDPSGKPALRKTHRS